MPIVIVNVCVRVEKVTRAFVSSSWRFPVLLMLASMAVLGPGREGTGP